MCAMMRTQTSGEVRDSYSVRSNRESGFGRYEERIRHYGLAFEGKRILIA